MCHIAVSHQCPPYIPPSPRAVAFGFQVPTSLLARLLGGFVIAYAIYQMLPLPELRGSRVAASYCGLLGGLVGTLFGTGGPFYVIYLNLRGLDRAVFRATFAMNFLIDGGVYPGTY